MRPSISPLAGLLVLAGCFPDVDRSSAGHACDGLGLGLGGSDPDVEGTVDFEQVQAKAETSLEAVRYAVRTVTAAPEGLRSRWAAAVSVDGQGGMLVDDLVMREGAEIQVWSPTLKLWVPGVVEAYAHSLDLARIRAAVGITTPVSFAGSGAVADRSQAVGTVWAQFDEIIDPANPWGAPKLEPGLVQIADGWYPGERDVGSYCAGRSVGGPLVRVSDGGFLGMAVSIRVPDVDGRASSTREGQFISAEQLRPMLLGFGDLDAQAGGGGLAEDGGGDDWDADDWDADDGESEEEGDDGDDGDGGDDGITPPDNDPAGVDAPRPFG